MIHFVYETLGVLILLATVSLTLELGVLSICAILRPRQQTPDRSGNLRLAVVVPAHNEEKLIATCVRSLLDEHINPVEIFVVAHNCTDRTAEVASAAGARVLPLCGPVGKGLALDHGFQTALALGAEAVLVIDADSVVSKNLLGTVVGAIRSGAGAVQVRYMASNPTTNQRTRLAALSLFGMNVVRPRGRAHLGLSCGIFGNGFALSSATLLRLPYTANSLVEDLEYHISLVSAGIKVRFLDHASVFGEMPQHASAASTQRVRWEGGRANMRRTFAWPMIKRSLGGDYRLIEPLLDLLALPLATQLPLLLLALAFPVPWLRVYSLFALLSVILYVAASCLLAPNLTSSLKAIASAPLYIAWKFSIIPKTLLATRHKASWIRTQRN